MANKFQMKRTSTSLRLPNTTNSGNGQYIDAGELALNMADGILYSSDGTLLLEIGANNSVLKSSSILTVGNSTVNATVNSTSVKVMNSTSNATFSIPTTTQWSGGNYYLNANGSWTQVSGGSVGGANTNVLINDSGSANGTSGFTYDKSTNNVLIANTLLVGNSTVNAVINSTAVKVMNSTSNGLFSLPSAAQVGAGTYYLNANGLWTTVTASAAAAGSNTQVQFNDSGYANASAAFTFDKSTNTLSVDSMNVTVTSSFQVTPSATFYVGNSTVNNVINSTAIVLANSTSNTLFALPSAAQYTNGGYYHNANGSWTQLPGGSNTQIQFNDSGILGGNAGFVFNKSSNIAFVGNSFVVGANGSYTIISTETLRVQDNANTVGQIVVWNANSGVEGSADVVLASSDGSDTTNYIDLGINSNNYSNASFMSGPRDGYLYTANSNLFIGTQNANDVIFLANGHTSAKEITRMTVGGMSWPTSNGDTAPASGRGMLFMDSFAGMALPAVRNDASTTKIMQPHQGRTRHAMVAPVNAATTQHVWGTTTANQMATVTRTTATTSLFTQTRRLAVSTNTTAGAVACVRSAATQWMLGNAAGTGGFHFVSRFGESIPGTNARFFNGLKNSTTVITNGTLTSQTNIIGIYFDSADTNYKLLTANATVSNTVDLGSGFTCQSSGNTNMIEFSMYAPPNSTTVKYRVINLTTGNVASGTFPVPSPVVNTLLAWQFWVTNNAGTATNAVDFAGLYIDSDNTG